MLFCPLLILLSKLTFSKKSFGNIIMQFQRVWIQIRPTFCLSCSRPKLLYRRKNIMGESRGGSRSILKSHKSIGFLSNTGPDPLNNHKATKSQHSMLGHHWPASKTPSMAFCWRADDGPLLVVFGSLIKKTTTKNVKV